MPTRRLVEPDVRMRRDTFRLVIASIVAVVVTGVFVLWIATYSSVLVH
jgi:hypothetical protein